MNSEKIGRSVRSTDDNVMIDEPTVLILIPTLQKLQLYNTHHIGAHTDFFESAKVPQRNFELEFCFCTSTTHALLRGYILIAYLADEGPT